MAGNRVVCTTNNVEYISIRKAMIQGVRTKEELEKAVNTCGTCPGCVENLGWILTSVCGCQKVSLQTVVEVVENGATSVEEVGELTGAGTTEGCGRCKPLIQNIIDLGR